MRTCHSDCRKMTVVVSTAIERFFRLTWLALFQTHDKKQTQTAKEQNDKRNKKNKAKQSKTVRKETLK